MAWMCFTRWLAVPKKQECYSYTVWKFEPILDHLSVFENKRHTLLAACIESIIRRSTCNTGNAVRSLSFYLWAQHWGRTQVSRCSYSRCSYISIQHVRIQLKKKEKETHSETKFADCSVLCCEMLITQFLFSAAGQSNLTVSRHTSSTC